MMKENILIVGNSRMARQTAEIRETLDDIFARDEISVNIELKLVDDQEILPENVKRIASDFLGSDWFGVMFYNVPGDGEDSSAFLKEVYKNFRTMNPDCLVYHYSVFIVPDLSARTFGQEILHLIESKTSSSNKQGWVANRLFKRMHRRIG
jgi:hypothetical protein